MGLNGNGLSYLVDLTIVIESVMYDGWNNNKIIIPKLTSIYRKCVSYYYLWCLFNTPLESNIELTEF